MVVVAEVHVVADVVSPRSPLPSAEHYLEPTLWRDVSLSPLRRIDIFHAVICSHEMNGSDHKKKRIWCGGKTLFARGFRNNCVALASRHKKRQGGRRFSFSNDPKLPFSLLRTLPFTGPGIGSQSRLFSVFLPNHSKKNSSPKSYTDDEMIDDVVR